ncbi:MAG TPA: VOC family protein [Acidimicrobiia bacterium]|nr:VOC family protein [Acidimicrobiia bacterium]
MIALDHVILVATDIDAAADELLRRHGLASVPGGRHTGHGTANRIVPLGDSYLEIMGVVDAAEAETSVMGRWALAAQSRDLQPRSLCLRTDDIAPIATTLGETPLAMDRVRTDGTRLSWQLAGLDGMLHHALPFFIQWEVEPGDHPGAASAPHRVTPRGISGVVLGTVTGPAAITIAAVPGITITRFRPGVRWVSVGTTEGEIRIGEG